MALANVGYILATDPSYGGKKVLMIDWDLEAPGLHRFFYKEFKEALRVRSTGSEYRQALDQKSGLLDFAIEARDFYETSYSSENLPESHAAIPRAREIFDRIVVKVDFDKLPLKLDGIPNLWLLKAGRQDPTSDYGDKVRKFDWENFYRRYGSFFTHFRAYLMRNFDFILIDSRTGLTDVGGICTKVMPEKLVAVFVPNSQNLEGLAGCGKRDAAT